MILDCYLKIYFMFPCKPTCKAQSSVFSLHSLPQGVLMNFFPKDKVKFIYT